jgi:hypothetical protein
MKAMLPTFDVDLSEPRAAAEYAAQAARIDEALELRRVA